jgi:hypothetical protein
MLLLLPLPLLLLLLLSSQKTKHFHGILNTGACVGVRDKLNPLAPLKQGMVVKAHQSLCEYDVVYKDGRREDLLPAHRYMYTYNHRTILLQVMHCRAADSAAAIACTAEVPAEAFACTLCCLLHEVWLRMMLQLARCAECALP